jgi:hypothetical protein
MTYREAQVCLGPAWANSYYLFSVSGGNTLTNIYTNGTLTTPFANTGRATADTYGRFQPIYLDPSIIYRVRFFNSAGVQQWQSDPYYSQLSTVGTSSLSTYGFQIATTGEVTLDAPATGGTGVTLTLSAGALGTTALQVTGTLAGNSAIIINSSATTGTQTATFAATNKPGPNITNTLLATAAPSGATYTGGTLTANYPGATTSSAVIVLSTGQIISGATFTAGSATFTTPSTSITGTPTTTLLVTGPQASSPAGWLPITCDGVQYYTPIWHDNNFTPYAPNPTAVGEIIVASSVTFGGSGLTSVVGGTATPGNWFSPTTVGIGAGYYIKITKTSGLSGVQFSAANGSYANITSGGLTITSNAQATITGTYTLSSSVSGSPIVAAGTITLSNNNGVQSPTYSGAANLILAGNGTATLNGVSTSNWYAPTTANVGSGYYLLITQTGGTSGYTFSTATGTPANITNGGLTIGINGSGSSTYFVSGTYIISSDSAGAVVLGSGTITLNGGFVPVTHTYTTGTSATETVPTGASHCYIEVLGSGGGGNSTGSNTAFGADGGGGGLAVLSSVGVAGGNTFTYTVGAGATAVFNTISGNSGQTTSVTGSVAGGAVSLLVTGGGGGQYGSGVAYGGFGGTASGGTTNTQGNTGGTGASGRGGNGLSGTYVTGGTGGLSNNSSGANGANGGNYGAGSGAATNNGTVGSSGAGSGGQIAFYYT